MAVAQRSQRLRLWQDSIETQVDITGSGPPLVFLHGPWGLRTDGAFLDLLASSHTVYAPRHPGTSQGDPDAIHQLDNWFDLVVYYGELFDQLGELGVALRVSEILLHLAPLLSELVWPFQLLQPPAGVPSGVLVGVDRRVVHPLLSFCVRALDFLDERVDRPSRHV